MKTIRSAAILILSLAFLQNGHTQCYELVWSDEFNGNALDGNKWGIYEFGWNGSSVQNCYRRDNVAVNNGTLKLTAKYEPGVSCTPGQDFTSGFVQTKDKAYWTFGRFEARIKLPASNSTWPAFWMSPQADDYGGWPRSGEIDIFESKGHDLSRSYGNAHWGISGGNKQQEKGTYTFPAGNDAGNWHVYAVEWSLGELKFFIDGNHYHTINDFDQPNATTHPGPFDKDFYLRLNMAVGGAYLDAPWNNAYNSTGQLPATMEVDWVRVYQLNNDCNPVTTDCDLVSNGDFGNGTTDWTLFKYDGANGSLSVQPNGYLKIDVTATASPDWKLALRQAGIALEQGKTYSIRYDAYADANRSGNIIVSQVGGAQYAFINQSFSTTPTTYTEEFTMSAASDPAAIFNLNVGFANVDVYVDNIHIREVGCVSAQALFSPGVVVGIVEPANAVILEGSGLVASRGNPSVYWTHNDRMGSADGTLPMLFAIDDTGRYLGTYELPSPAIRHDFEDIAIGPGPVSGVDYIYVGDIGDTITAHPAADNIVYRIPEPAVVASQINTPLSRTLKGVEAITLRFPDGLNHNCEAMMVDPVTGDLFVITKGNYASPGQPTVTDSRLFRAPAANLVGGTASTLEWVGDISALPQALNGDRTTGGDISSNGREILVRTYRHAFLWERDVAAGQTIGDALVNGAPARVPLTIGAFTANADTAIPPTETGSGVGSQGESIAFDAVGRNYVSHSENNGSARPLYRYDRIGGPCPAPLEEMLLPPGSIWQYLDNGTDPGSQWQTNLANDGGWVYGSAQLGYGDGDQATTISYGPNAANKPLAVFFRRSLNFPDPSQLGRIMGRLLYDDGAAVYINGVEVARFGLAPNAAWNDPANSQQFNELEDTWFTFDIPDGVLVPGFNMVAVEVHQVSPSSSDLSFDFQLVADPCSDPIGDELVDLVFQSRDDWGLWNMRNTDHIGTVVGSPLPAGAKIGAYGTFFGDPGPAIAYLSADRHVLLQRVDPNMVLLGPPMAVGSLTLGWTLRGSGDFNADGLPDLVFQHDDGRLAVWFTSNGIRTSAALFPSDVTSDPLWRLAAIDDFNVDGHDDLLFQHADGRCAVWNMQGIALQRAAYLDFNVDGSVQWRIVASGDANGDGFPDIYWQHWDGRANVWHLQNETVLARLSADGPDRLRSIRNSGFQPRTPRFDWDDDGRNDLFYQENLGRLAVWLMDGDARLSSFLMSDDVRNDPTWRVVGLSDINGDCHEDIVWQRDNGDTKIWLMNGATNVGENTPSHHVKFAPQWRIVGIADLNRDGLDDWVFQNRTEGGLIVWYMDGAQRIGTETISGGSGTLWRLEAVIDMNSDSHPDFVWQNTVNANLAIWRMNGPTLSQAIAIPDPIAPVWKLENAMDLDHDGHPDLIFKHRTDGRQYVWYMSGITRVGAAPLGSVSSAWSLRHSGD